MQDHDFFYKTLLDNLTDGVYYVDRERSITYWNQGAERLTGYETQRIVGSRCSENLLMCVDDQGNRLCETKCPLAETMEDGDPHTVEVYLHHREGHRVPVSVRVTPIREASGQITGAVEIFTDNSPLVTARQRIEELRALALLDSLTQIGNRRHAETNLRSRLDEFDRYGWQFGLLFSDIDHFKRVNDTWGHEIGDAILIMVAKTLANSLRPFDIICRWGGEEFVALIINVDEEKLRVVANRLRALVEQSSLTVGSDTLRVTVSVGGTIVRSGDNTESLVRRADELMYHSKKLGRNCVTL